MLARLAVPTRLTFGGRLRRLDLDQVALVLKALDVEHAVDVIDLVLQRLGQQVILALDSYFAPGGV
jgi:hypothetical protein